MRLDTSSALELPLQRHAMFRSGVLKESGSVDVVIFTKAGHTGFFFVKVELTWSDEKEEGVICEESPKAG